MRGPPTRKNPERTKRTSAKAHGPDIRVGRRRELISARMRKYTASGNRNAKPPKSKRINEHPPGKPCESQSNRHFTECCADNATSLSRDRQGAVLPDGRGSAWADFIGCG